jgi:hypothetical protein
MVRFGNGTAWESDNIRSIITGDLIQGRYYQHPTVTSLLQMKAECERKPHEQKREPHDPS